MSIEFIIHADEYRITCDRCGEDHWINPDVAGKLPREELIEAGWYFGPETSVKFTSGAGPLTVKYSYDHCPDCADHAPVPIPRTVARPPRPTPRDPFDNDPCDEWPRALIWKALGLRGDCGHPGAQSRIYSPCPRCDAGYPIGRNDQKWR